MPAYIARKSDRYCTKAKCAYLDQRHVSAPHRTDRDQVEDGLVTEAVVADDTAVKSGSHKVSKSRYRALKKYTKQVIDKATWKKTKRRRLPRPMQAFKYAQWWSWSRTHAWQ